MQNVCKPKLFVLIAALSALAAAPAADAAQSNGTTVALNASCTPGTAGTGAGGSGGVYDTIYGGPYSGTPGSTTTGAGCAGSVTLRATLPKANRRRASATARRQKKINFGRANYQLVANGSATLEVTLTAKGRKALRRLRKVKTKVLVNATPGGTLVVQPNLTVRLKGKRRKK